MSAMRDEEMSDITGDVSDSLERSSDHSATAASFKRRKLRFKMAQKTNTGTAATVQTRVDSFAGTHLGDPPTKQQTTQETLAKSLLTALMTPTKGEVQYDKLLFDAWKAWLPTISTASWKECIVLQYHRDPDSAPTSEPLMATCLTRQLTQDDLPFLKKSSNVGVATRKSANDHSVVFVRRENVVKPWQIQYCTSVVKIKMLDTSVALATDVNGRVKKVDLRDSGPIVQWLSYVSTLVWPSLVDMCIPTGKMRLTAIAGKRTTHKTAHGNNARYITGMYMPANKCGSNFKYSLVSYASANVDDDGIRTLDEYLLNIETGITNSQAYVDLAQATTVWVKCPLGGLSAPDQLVELQADKTTMQLIGSPILTGIINSNQGDFWEMTINPKKLAQSNSLHFVRSNADDNECSVLAKVSSSAFGVWVDPNESNKALQMMSSADVHLGCLLAFWVLQTGLLTVTGDLRKAGYIDLSPSKYTGGSLASLWRGLGPVLKNTLIPAARLGIVHSDLRAGSNRTANIVVNQTADGSFDLQIIDFDSFCLLDEHPDGVSSLERTLVPDGDMKALDYLLLQVHLLGQAWLKEIDQASVRGQVVTSSALAFGIGEEPIPEIAITLLWQYYGLCLHGQSGAFGLDSMEAAVMAEWRNRVTVLPIETLADDDDIVAMKEAFSAIGITGNALHSRPIP